MDTLEELSIFTDEECKPLCKLVYFTGGTITNSNVAGTRDGARAGAPARIPNPGLVVPIRAVTNLKLACFYVRHQERTSSTFVLLNIILVNASSLRALLLKENAHKDSTNVPLVKTVNWLKNLEQMAL